MANLYKPVIWVILAIGLSLVFFCNTKDAGTAVLLGTAVLVVWYSYETFQLRQTTQKTLDIEQTPVLALQMRPSQFLAGVLDLCVKNIGHQNAYDMTFHPFSVGELNCVFYFDDPHNYIEPAVPGSNADRLMWVVHNNDGASYPTEGLRLLYDAMQNNRATAVLLFHYSDAIGQRYHGIYTLSSKVSLHFEAFLQYIATGKGEITFAQAEKIIKNVPKVQHYALTLDAYIKGRNKDIPKN